MDEADYFAFGQGNALVERVIDAVVGLAEEDCAVGFFIVDDVEGAVFGRAFHHHMFDITVVLAGDRPHGLSHCVFRIVDRCDDRDFHGVG